MSNSEIGLIAICVFLVLSLPIYYLGQWICEKFDKHSPVWIKDTIEELSNPELDRPIWGAFKMLLPWIIIIAAASIYYWILG